MALTASQLSAINSTITLTSSPSVIGNSAVNWHNLNTLNPTTFSLSDFGPTSHELLRKYEVYESSESIIALSVTAHRLFKESKIHYKITDRDLYSKVTPEDRVLADQIKDYYSKKIMMWNLKGSGTKSSFRKDMNTLIHSDCLTFKENMIGIAYWLPEFYQYDIDMDVIKMDLTKDQGFDNMNKKGTPGVLKLSERLTPIKRVQRKSKRSKAFEYWFKNDQHDAGVVIVLEEKNQLQHLWDKIFNTEKVLTIEGFYVRRRLDDFEYYSVQNWSIVEA